MSAPFRHRGEWGENAGAQDREFPVIRMTRSPEAAVDVAVARNRIVEAVSLPDREPARHQTDEREDEAREREVWEALQETDGELYLGTLGHVVPADSNEQVEPHGKYGLSND